MTSITVSDWHSKTHFLIPIMSRRKRQWLDSDSDEEEESNGRVYGQGQGHGQPDVMIRRSLREGRPSDFSYIETLENMTPSQENDQRLLADYGSDEGSWKNPEDVSDEGLPDIPFFKKPEKKNNASEEERQPLADIQFFKKPLEKKKTKVKGTLNEKINGIPLFSRIFKIAIEEMEDKRQCLSNLKWPEILENIQRENSGWTGKTSAAKASRQKTLLLK